VRPLTEAARRAGSIRATGGFSGAAKRWQERAVTGMSDAALAEALAGELGISGGPAASTFTMPLLQFTLGSEPAFAITCNQSKRLAGCFGREMIGGTLI
jgi:hypothetical protein